MKSSFSYIFALFISTVSGGSDQSEHIIPPHLTALANDSPVTCATDNIACDALDDNFLDSIGGVATIAECRQLCYDNAGCLFLTFYSRDSFPFQETCNLFSSCEEIHPCTECVSETRDCYQVCGTNVVGVIDENNLASFVGVETEAECRNHCRATNNCSYYTYFLEEDPNSQLCIALSHLIEPLQPCDTCLTGPLECGDTSKSRGNSNSKGSVAWILINFAGLIISGGDGAGSSVEIVDIWNNRSCRLDDLPDKRTDHTQAWGQHKYSTYLMCPFFVEWWPPMWWLLHWHWWHLPDLDWWRLECQPHPALW